MEAALQQVQLRHPRRQLGISLSLPATHFSSLSPLPLFTPSPSRCDGLKLVATQGSAICGLIWFGLGEICALGKTLLHVWRSEAMHWAGTV